MIDTISLVNRVAAANYKDIIIDPELGQHTNQNEFLVFLKPEIFMGPPEDQVKRIELINDKLEEYDVTVDGMIAVGGSLIEEKGIMSAHYGFINTLSNTASTLVTAGDRAKMTELLGEDCSILPIFGGHEALKQFPDMTPEALDTFWFTKKSLKVRGGFYFQKYTYGGMDFLLVDGFHPYQIAYYTESSRRVLLLICHSTTSWKSLRWDLIGATFPEKASPTSIRGILYANAKDFGYEKVDIGNNGTHLSAGPFEAMAELTNFVGKTIEQDLLMQTDFAKILVSRGLDQATIESTVKNPPITTQDGATNDLYGLTEDMSPQDAADLYLHAKK